MNKQEIIDAEKQYIVHTYGRADFVLDHGQGVYLFDTDGNRYIDCLAGIAVNNGIVTVTLTWAPPNYDGTHTYSASTAVRF